MVKNLKTVQEYTGQIRYSKDFSRTLSKYSGFRFRDCLTELADNSKESIEGPGGMISIGIAQPNFKNGLNLYIVDNGCGMSAEDIEKKLFNYGADNSKKGSVNASLGGKNACQRLMGDSADSRMEIFSKKDGSLPVHVTWDGSNEFVVGVLSEESCPDEIKGHGTIIAIYGSNLGDNDADDEKKFLSVRYLDVIKSESNPDGITITINGETLKGEDPLYRDIPDIDTGEDGAQLSISFTETVIGPQDGKNHDVGVLMRDITQFSDSRNAPINGFTPIGWDTDSNGNLRIKNTETSGVYVEVGDTIICAAAEFSMFFKRKMHNQMNGLRILVKMPVELAKQLKFHYNKSKGFSDIQKERSLVKLTSRMSNEFEKLLQNMVRITTQKHEEETRDYKGVKTTQTGDKIRFSVNNEMKMPSTMFAMKNNATGGFMFNPDSTLLRSASKNAKRFKDVAAVAENMLVCFYDTMYDISKFQPSFGLDSHPRSAAISARDQIVERAKQVFEEKFMTMK